MLCAMNNDKPLPSLELRSVSLSFVGPQGAFRVLNRVDFEIFAGQSLAILGSSGSGKTTLLNILGALLTPDSGHVLWNSTPLTRNDLDERRRNFMGFIFQSHILIPELTVIENVELPLRISGEFVGRKRQLAWDLLSQVGLEKRLNFLPAQLSGGERQRVAIARALVNHPTFVIADEPTGSLDEQSAAFVSDILFDLCQKRKAGLILVTHNEKIANKADRRMILKGGTLTAVP